MFQWNALNKVKPSLTTECSAKSGRILLREISLNVKIIMNIKDL
jgi:hypothetical protein